MQQERARRHAYRKEYQLQKLENTNPFFNRIRCGACGGMVVRGYGKAGREPFWRCAAACRKHKGTSTRTTFPEQEVRRVMCAAWAQLVENRAVYEAKWRATMESTEALALEKVRARQMMALMEGAGEAGRGPEGKWADTDGGAEGRGQFGVDGGAEGRGWFGVDGDAAGTWRGVFSEERAGAEIWVNDGWIRVVLEYMIASEREYRVGFLDGSEVTVTVEPAGGARIRHIVMS